MKSGIEALAIDGTSATTMLIDDRDGSELAEPKLYNEAQASPESSRIADESR